MLGFKLLSVLLPKSPCLSGWKRQKEACNELSMTSDRKADGGVPRKPEGTPPVCLSSPSSVGRFLLTSHAAPETWLLTAPKLL